MISTRLTIPAAVILAAGFLPLGALPAQAAPAAAADAAKSGDFNGDGYRDLAATGPTMTAGSVKKAGAVGVGYGSKSGLDTSKHQTISQASAGVPDEPEGGDQFGAAVASGDFDGDGFADLAVGAPEETVGSAAKAGSVTIVYGSANGLSQRSVVFSQGSDGVPGTSGDYTGFGGTLAAGDLNGDGYPDLAAKTESKSDGTEDHVIALHGGSKGLTAADADVVNKPPNSDFPDPDGEGWGVNEFGVGLAIGDVDADGTGDLVVGTNLKNVNGEVMGSVPATSYYKGGSGGVTATRAKSFPKVGNTLAAGDVNGDGVTDIAAGFGGHEFYSSQVTVLLGGKNGPRVDKTFDQNTDGVPGSDETEDGFGNNVALGDVTGDGKADLAIGAPGEATKAYGQGRVTLLRGSASGISFTDASYVDEDTKNVPGTGEKADLFGMDVALADFGNDGHADLAAGASNENGNGDVWEPDGDGSVTVLPGTASGFGTSGAALFGATTLGGVTAGANFGNPIAH